MLHKSTSGFARDDFSPPSGIYTGIWETFRLKRASIKYKIIIKGKAAVIELIQVTFTLAI